MIRSEKRLHKTHRRWRWAMLAVVLTFVGGGLCGTPSVRRAGIETVMPSTVLILMIGRTESNWAMDALHARLAPLNDYTQLWATHNDARNAVIQKRNGLTHWQWRLFHDELMKTTGGSINQMTCRRALDLIADYDLIEPEDGPALVALLDNPHLSLHIRTLRLLQHQRVLNTLNQAATVDRIAALIENGDHWVQRTAIAALSRANGQADRVLTIMTDVLDSDSDYLINYTLLALSTFESHHDVIQTTLIGRLQDPDFLYLEQTVLVLQEFGTAPDLVVGPLEEALTSDDPARVAVAASALGLLREDAAPVLPSLFQASDTDNPQVGSHVRFAIEEIFEGLSEQVRKEPMNVPDETLADMQYCLSHDNPRLFWGGVRWIEAVNVESTTAVPILIKLLHHEHTGIRVWVARRLGDWGPAAYEALPALRSVLQDDDDELREAARKAIENIETGR
ncbi:MAG: HEAT repeat domain-containing protein [Phycisphaerales bacterium]|nr:MAG: HEAT repeat domain-containing protein [Phycisphaerales bacterium]